MEPKKYNSYADKSKNTEFTATLKNITSLGDDAYEIEFSLNAPMQFKAGQYIWLVLNQLKSSPEIDRRAFSIISNPKNNTSISILLRNSKSHYKHILLGLKPGDKVKIYGPLGTTFVTSNFTDSNIIMLAGGVGIAPFLSILKENSDPGKHYYIIYNLRYKETLYVNELKQLEQNNKNITVSVHHEQLKSSHIPKNINSKILISGPKNYVQNANNILLDTGYRSKNFVFEQFYPNNTDKKQILNLTNYLSKFNKQSKQISIDQFSANFFDKVKIQYFKYFLILSILGVSLILFIENFVLNISLTTNYNLVLILYLAAQLIILFAHLLSKKYYALVFISINALAVTMLAYQYYDVNNTVAEPWLLISVALMYLFFSRKLATINSLIYILIAFSFLLFANNDSNTIFGQTIVSPIIFSLYSIVVLSIFFAMSKLTQTSKKTIESNISAFDVLLKSFSDSPNHIVITDINGTVLFANNAAAQNTGYPINQMLGQSPRLWGGLMDYDFYKNLWDNAQKGHVINTQLANRNKMGEVYYVKARISPIKNSQKKIIGFLASEENITDIVEAEMSLEKSKQKIENIIQGTDLGAWELNIITNKVTINERWANIIGYTLAELGPVNSSKIQQLIHPDDLPVYQDALNNHIKDTSSFYKAKYRLKHKNGTWIWVQDHGKIMSWLPNGQPEIMYGSFRDISKEQEIDQAKSEFVSLASHQLRTPLSSINWYTEILLSDKKSKLNKSQAQYLNEIYLANKRMSILVDDLLNVSRLELGTFVLKSQVLNLEQISKQIINELTPKITEKQQKLVVTFTKDLPSIEFDQKYLEMIYQNLLSNSVKYTPSKGTIRLDVSSVSGKNVVDGYKIPQDGILIAVKDNGYGIPVNQQKHIFSKMFRAENAKTIDTDGTGLGLYILQSIVNYSGGNIWFVSEQNKGSTFNVFLPLKTPPKQ